VDQPSDALAAGPLAATTTPIVVHADRLRVFTSGLHRPPAGSTEPSASIPHLLKLNSKVSPEVVPTRFLRVPLLPSTDRSRTLLAIRLTPRPRHLVIAFRVRSRASYTLRDMAGLTLRPELPRSLVDVELGIVLLNTTLGALSHTRYQNTESLSHMICGTYLVIACDT
jgi:hypothetical protein